MFQELIGCLVEYEALADMEVTLGAIGVDEVLNDGLKPTLDFSNRLEFAAEQVYEHCPTDKDEPRNPMNWKFGGTWKRKSSAHYRIAR